VPLSITGAHVACWPSLQAELSTAFPENRLAEAPRLVPDALAAQLISQHDLCLSGELTACTHRSACRCPARAQLKRDTQPGAPRALVLHSCNTWPSRPPLCPPRSGFVAWVTAAFGPFWGFQVCPRPSPHSDSRSAAAGLSNPLSSRVRAERAGRSPRPDTCGAPSIHPQEGLWSWISGVTDNSLYPVMLAANLEVRRGRGLT
jgi:hypothetical protein